jgi:hypothetical protein
MYENSRLKSIKNSKTKKGLRKNTRRDEYDPSTLYACMEVSQ